VLRGIAKSQPKADQAEPLMLDQLQDILAHMDPARPADLRDSAALVVPWAGALRSAEASALDWQRAGPEHDGANAGWIETVEEGALITLTRSKTRRSNRYIYPGAWARQTLVAGGRPAERPVLRCSKADAAVECRRTAAGAVDHPTWRRIAALQAQGPRRRRRPRRRPRLLRAQPACRLSLERGGVRRRGVEVAPSRPARDPCCRGLLCTAARRLDHQLWG
jgi:hypothetical protein